MSEHDYDPPNYPPGTMLWHMERVRSAFHDLGSAILSEMQQARARMFGPMLESDDDDPCLAGCDPGDCQCSVGRKDGEG